MTGILADVAPIPTGLIDFLYLGIPAGIFVGAVIIAGAIFLFRLLRRRGRGRAFSAAMAVLLLVLSNFACYATYVFVIWPHNSHERYLQRLEADRARADVGQGSEPDAGP